MILNVIGYSETVGLFDAQPIKVVSVKHAERVLANSYGVVIAYASVTERTDGQVIVLIDKLEEYGGT